MFDQANSFYICANLCKRELDKKPQRHDLYSTPEIVNLAFACEVYIKTLLDFYGIEFGKKHKLNELFALLPEKMRNEIDKQTFFIHPVYSAINRQILTDPLGRKLLDVEADAFVNWRYSYEKYPLSCHVGFLRAFSEVLRDECCARLYKINWADYCKISKINLDL